MIFTLLFLGLSVLVPTMELRRARRARIQSQKKLEITMAYGEASKAYYEAFDDYFDELGKDQPCSEKVDHLYRRFLETQTTQDALFTALKTT